MYLSTFYFFFFFSSRRRHTRWNCDWSSDVCSSDLERLLHVEDRAYGPGLAGLEVEQRRDHSRRSEIERERVATAAGVPCLDVDQQVVDEDGGHLPARAA